MSVQRLTTLTNTAITYIDSRGETAFLIPVLLPDGEWQTLAEDGLNSFGSAESCRQFVVDWQRDLEASGEEVTDADRECWAAYEALAVLFEELS